MYLYMREENPLETLETVRTLGEVRHYDTRGNDLHEEHFNTAYIVA